MKTDEHPTDEHRTDIDLTDEHPTDEHPTDVDLTPSEAWALLRSAPVGRLAVSTDDQPDIFPVNHVVDQGSVVFRTSAGTKLSSAIGRHVAFEADGYDLSDASAWSVVIKGVAVEIRDIEETITALRLPLFPWHAGPKPRFVRIEPVSVTGRRIQVSGGASTPAPTADDAS